MPERLPSGLGHCPEGGKMKINDTSNLPIQMDAYVKQARLQDATETTRPGIQGPTDKVQLSDEARAILQASKTEENQTDIREGIVQQVKLGIEKGTYRVDGQKVAANMLKEGFENDLLLQKINTRA
jgi:flagellar biosynthesis anti-sigma factor FlgM